MSDQYWNEDEPSESLFNFAPGAFVEHVAAYDRGMGKMLLGERVIVAGSGPLDEEFVRDVLSACDIELWPLESPLPDVLVLGQGGWDADLLGKAVMQHNDSRLKVYSHEMLLATLVAGVDVYRHRSLEELASFAVGHPALSYLSGDMGFDWPSTEVVLSEVVHLSGDLGDWPDKGVLKQLGYEVGKTRGLDRATRRKILDRIFLRVRLAAGAGASTEYVAEWGDQNSSERLRKMANCLASFTRSAKRRRGPGDYSVAIRHWEEDLLYLRVKYYDPRRGFQWPDISL